jgi:GLUG motif-containing protein
MSRFLSKVSVISTSVLWLAVALCSTSSAYAAVTISTAATSNMSCVSGVCTPTAANAVLNVNDLTTMLGSENVQVNTGTGSLAQQVEDIIVAAGFNWASVNSLTLDAYRSVTFGQPVAVNGSGAVSLVTNDGGTGGALSFISGGSLSFLSPTNSLSINAKIYSLASNIATLAADIATNPSGSYALSAGYNAASDGTYKGSPIPTKLKGAFNGLGNTISNLTIKGSENDKLVGFFAHVDASGGVSSVVLASASITLAANKKEGISAGGGILAGENFGTIFNAFTAGDISGKLVPNRVLALGGLVGGNAGRVLDSASTASVSVSAKKPSYPVEAGGLIGASTGSIESSYATGTISMSNTVPSESGGLVGYNEGPIENCYAEDAASVSANSSAGGLVGQNLSMIANSYSTGVVTAGSESDVGGLVGYDSSQGGLSNAYWDTTTSGITNLSQGAGNIANDPGITGETSAQLQAGLPTGFDPTIWAENPSINSGLPYLIANPPQ